MLTLYDLGGGAALYALTDLIIELKQSPTSWAIKTIV